MCAFFHAQELMDLYEQAVSEVIEHLTSLNSHASEQFVQETAEVAVGDALGKAQNDFWRSGNRIIAQDIFEQYIEYFTRIGVKHETAKAMLACDMFPEGTGEKNA